MGHFAVVNKIADIVKPDISAIGKPVWGIHCAISEERKTLGDPIPVYVINLERSRDRWARLQANATALAIELRRIEAVEGIRLKPDELEDFDEAGFRRNHGKIAMPAEIGCYFSHIRALDVIAKATEPFAVLVEDDVVLPPDFQSFVEKLTHFTGWDAIKLVNHRTPAFRSFQKIDDDIAIGRCMHGPLGSSAAYVVTRAGAARLLAAIRPMRVPYDVALERGWAGNYEIYTTNKAIVGLSEVAISTIVQGRADYAKKRLPPYKRLTTLFFRATDYVGRIIYAVKWGSLKRAAD